ncbi:hypothetical protein [Kordiimonas aestuarii]|uniref:hypothetical protein n=1 Tax=Kordiimonas aestuarii TaxID=1005925 RepID=UPI0021D1F266|nr:hypothetical protein [Kordiimonas aestuarii]
MRRPELYVNGPDYGYGENPSQSFDLQWPLSEVMLSAEMSCDQTIEDIARKYRVNVGDVLSLREKYELDFG